SFERVIGILNGTTNYILTRMFREGCSYEAALKSAQELGYAERDPSSDVEGLDAARKIAILARLAFGADVKLEDVQRMGISALSEDDIRLAMRMNCTIKLVAGAVAQEKGVSVFVRPAFVELGHPLASVGGVFNALFLSGDCSGELMLYGRGAGARPTASSVAGDIIEICRNIAAGSSSPRIRQSGAGGPGALPAGELWCGYCIRMTVEDRPRVLEGVAGAFGANCVSLRSVVQTPLGEGEAELILICHPHREADIKRSLKELEGRDYVKNLRSFMCLEATKEDAL
ncbi:MAG: homoserine dehydrogenase, partial [Oscillospiraceae bacterium]|nr:homoserine dehydrogenase [Oscillospiraceae bacterium]